MALIGARATPRLAVFLPRVWMSIRGIVESGNLLQLAIDRLRLPAREDVFVVEGICQKDLNAGRSTPTGSAHFTEQES
jgi:hypothetical protein